MEPPFQPGDEVRLLDNPNRTGIVLKVDLDPQFGEWTVRVRVDGRARMLMAVDLELVDEEPSDPWEDLANGVLAPARDLRTLLTYERLRHPPGPVGRAFGTARARLYPYQFKPLVKFLENPLHTLLIADEVGLGKTIEAGYILREWKERQTLDTVLIVVPARLRTKWQGEMAKRFDERFDLVSAREVRAMLRNLQLGRELEAFQWIASYESLRLPDIIEGLRAGAPPLDLVILDEAHRIRNRETNQYRLGRALARSAQAMLFLTATPVQTSLDNLHTLLDLLQPEAFGDVRNFEQLIDANRPVMRASSLAAAGRFSDAAEELESLGRNPLTRALHQEPSVQQLLQDLREQVSATRRRRVSLQAAVADLSLTGHLITRTRKNEVFENRAKRSAQPVYVELSEAERTIYQAIEAFTRLLHPDASSWGRSMAALMAYRYTASSIPAAVGYIASRLSDRGFSVDIDDMGQEVEVDELEEEGHPSQDRAIAADIARVRQALALCPTPAEDSKLQELLRALRHIWSDDREAGRRRRKVIVFSFFKRTLGYLSEQLDRAGFSNALIHGGVPIVEREDRIEAFLRDERIDVLLSSEVGGEGLDLQAASVVVNYDLPWNPMVVEQRIGRVDRIGQESERIVILNLACSDTVEDNILLRLYDRVNLFEASIGEMEDILGSSEVRELIVAQLRGDLSARELEERVEQTAQAALRRRHDAEKLSSQVDGLLAADQAILDQIRMLVDGNRLPGEQDIADLVRGFLEFRFPGVRIHGDPTRQIAELDLPVDGRTRFEQWSDARGGEGRFLVGEMRRGPLRFTVNADVAMRSARAEFVQARHPLVQFSVDQMSSETTLSGAAFGVRVACEGIPAGHWLVGLSSIEFIGGDRRTELACGAARIAGPEVLVGEDAEPMLRAILAELDELDPRPSLDPRAVEDASDRMQAAFRSYLIATRNEQRALAERRLARRRATWEATLQQQLQRAADHLEAMRHDGAPFAVRMAEAKLRKRQAEYDRITEGFAAAPTFRLMPTEVAVALVEVVGA